MNNYFLKNVLLEWGTAAVEEEEATLELSTPTWRVEFGSVEWGQRFYCNYHGEHSRELGSLAEVWEWYEYEAAYRRTA